MVLVHDFLHGLQVVYSRTKVEVDSAVQFCSEMNYIGISVGLAGNLALYYKKTLLFNTVLAWFITQCKHHLYIVVKFLSLDRFRENLNRTIPFLYLSTEVSVKLLDYSKELNLHDSGTFSIRNEEG